MKIIGIDNSITSPGIVIMELNDSFEILNQRFITCTTIKKYSFKDCNGEVIYYKDTFNSQYEKIQSLHNIVMNRIGNPNDYDFIAIEDYSFASKGQTFSIAESTGLLKDRFYNANIPIRLYAVPSIKQFMTQKGNADKIRMEEYYEKKSYKFDLSFLPKLYESRNAKNPKDNIIDAHAIVMMLRFELMYRNGITCYDDINRHIFIEKTKKSKIIPYVLQDFIYKPLDLER
ncbi:MAG: hypothetical protein ACOC2U_00560 [bacterium]